MALQTDYAAALASGYPGLVIKGETSNRPTRTVEDAAGIPFGVPVYRGSSGRSCTRTPGGALLGFSIASSGLAALPGQQADRYPQFENAAILSSGVICVTAGDDVAKGAQAYDTGSGIVDAAEGNTELVGWVFETAAASGQLAVLAKR